MKALIQILILIAIFMYIPKTFAGIGGTSGGPKPQSILITAEVRTGESGEKVQIVRYYYRPRSPQAPEKCVVARGEAAYVPCALDAGVPEWLVKIMGKAKPEVRKIPELGPHEIEAP